jgi:hypothetical protein
LNGEQARIKRSGLGLTALIPNLQFTFG